MAGLPGEGGEDIGPPTGEGESAANGDSCSEESTAGDAEESVVAGEADGEVEYS